MFRIRMSLIVGLLMSLVACHAGPPGPLAPNPTPTVPFLIPRDVQRIAVLYPRPTTPDLANAYSRLEGATFELKRHRPELKIVDRFHVPILLEEYRFQLGGAVADDSAIRVGRILGVDSVLIYQIDGPSRRDRMWAESHQDLPPITVTSKVIRVESAEILYHHVVVTRIEDSTSWMWGLRDSVDYQRLSREAIERGIAQTVSELGRAFE